MNLPVSRLGFGLSGIAGSGNFAHQQKLIRTAIDCGITHFDVAPYYGSGDAEKILGDILATCPEKVTITTKYGLTPVGAGGSLLRATLRPILRRVQPVKKMVAALINRSHQPKQLTFEKGNLASSIDESIKKLRRPIDVFVLHDIETALAKNSELLEELDNTRSSGKTIMTGISGSAENVWEMVNWRKNTYQVAQLENSLLHDPEIDRFIHAAEMVITHRAIQGGLQEIIFLIEKRPDFKKIWLREFLIEPSKDNITKLLIEVALYENPRGTVLFSTTRPERIKRIADVITSPLLGSEGCRKLRTLYREVKIDNATIAG